MERAFDTKQVIDKEIFKRKNLLNNESNSLTTFIIIFTLNNFLI